MRAMNELAGSNGQLQKRDAVAADRRTVHSMCRHSVEPARVQSGAMSQHAVTVPTPCVHTWNEGRGDIVKKSMDDPKEYGKPHKH